ncbi:MAG: peptide chain release factor N(5)-glutamine methyltransferase, partial [Nitrospirae bacterium]|nr:peptide chain release factor N(5)-glutamine methyltransferase [Nitrospirota bacterium]
KKFLTSHFSLLAFDLIISNPPYIKTADIKTLQPEVKDWEPVIALDGGEDGLDVYRELIPVAKVFLKDNGILMLEMDLGQAGEITRMLKFSGYTEIEIIKDYAGIERVAKAKKKTCN